MNSLLHSIYQRRSVRAFDRGVPSEDRILDLLEAAMAAPSACARDPWHFVVVTDRDMLLRMAEGLPNGKFLTQAGAGIVVCGSLAEAHDGQLSYLLQDCAAAIENLLLAAPALGLGACWLGVHPREDRVRHLRSLLKIPPEVLPVAVLAVGNPAEHKPARTRYQAAKVHTNAW